jgi:hypothetical protein
MELGFWGDLLVSEAGTASPEMKQFMEIAVDEARGRFFFVAQYPNSGQQFSLRKCVHRMVSDEIYAKASEIPEHRPKANNLFCK